MGLIPESSPEKWRTFLRKAAGTQITQLRQADVVTRHNDRSYCGGKILSTKPDCNEYNSKRLIRTKWRESNPFDHDGSICFSKRLSHANVRTVPRMDQSVNGSEKQL
jgi:hypothetical protein